MFVVKHCICSVVFILLTACFAHLEPHRVLVLFVMVHLAACSTDLKRLSDQCCLCCELKLCSVSDLRCLVALRQLIQSPGGQNSSVGSAWARCPRRRGFDHPLGTFSVEGIFPLELTWVQTPFPPKLLRMRV